MLIQLCVLCCATPVAQVGNRLSDSLAVDHLLIDLQDQVCALCRTKHQKQATEYF